MIVDDEVFNIKGLRMRIKTMVKFAGLNSLIDSAHDGHDCVKKVKQALARNTVYSLIFMDLSMQEMDGYEATSEIRDLYDEHQ